MADEFTAIDLFCRRLHDDFHPGDTERFREYMASFQERQQSDMMNLKVKIQNVTSICRRVAKFYAVELEEGKPEFLFVVVDRLVAILADAKRALLKLEKERLKAERWKSIFCGLFLWVVVEIDIMSFLPILISLPTGTTHRRCNKALSASACPLRVCRYAF